MEASIAEIIIEGNYRRTGRPGAGMVVPQFLEIKEKFLKALETNTPVLIENSDLKLTQSIVIRLKYVGERWCQGEATYHRGHGTVTVPYTISYADLYLARNSQEKNINIIFKGDNPYGG